jgi:hypothetical protein
MTKTKEITAGLIKKIQQCMNEAGLKTEIRVSEHEATAFAIMQIEGETLRAVAHITDRYAKPAAAGALAPHQHLASAVIYPTLASQTAAGAGAGTRPHPGKPTKKA